MAGSAAARKQALGCSPTARACISGDAQNECGLLRDHSAAPIPYALDRHERRSTAAVILAAFDEMLTSRHEADVPAGRTDQAPARRSIESGRAQTPDAN